MSRRSQAAIGLGFVVSAVAISRGLWWLAAGIPGVPLLGARAGRIG